MTSDTNEPCGGCQRSIKHYDTSKLLTVKHYEDAGNRDGKCECRDHDGDQRTPDKCTAVDQCVLGVAFHVTIPGWGAGPGDLFLEEEYLDPIKGTQKRKLLPDAGGQGKNPLVLKLAVDGCGDKKERLFSVCRYDKANYPTYQSVGGLVIQASCGYCQGECADHKDPDPPAAGTIEN